MRLKSTQQFWAGNLLNSQSIAAVMRSRIKLETSCTKFNSITSAGNIRNEKTQFLQKLCGRLRFIGCGSLPLPSQKKILWQKFVK